MTTKRNFLLISAILILIGCTKKQSELEFEQSVVYEIFPSLIDSLNFDFRLNPPPPPRPILNEDGEIIGTDTIGIGKELANYKKRKTELKADSIKLIIAVMDSVRPLELTQSKHLLNHFSKQNLRINPTELLTQYKIDLKKLNASKKLEFKYLSDFPKGKEIWRKKYPFHFGGLTYLSRIQFDSTKSFGVLESGMSCGGLCGYGVRVYIKKVNEKWYIDKLEETWIS